jgi:AcrR family transcriptional regulator
MYHENAVAGRADVVVTRTYRMQARQEAVTSTRERILRAAYDQWLERPYDQVSIESVARAAGVSRQTVIRQFGTKDELAFAVVDWQKPYEEAFRSAEPGDIETAIARLVDRYEVMGDANVRILELEGRFPAFDYLLDISRASHRAWIERTLLPGPSPGDRDRAVLSLYAATDVTVWKLLRRDLKQSRSVTESVILRLVRAVLDDAPTRKGQRP